MRASRKGLIFTPSNLNLHSRGVHAHGMKREAMVHTPADTDTHTHTHTYTHRSPPPQPAIKHNYWSNHQSNYHSDEESEFYEVVGGGGKGRKGEKHLPCYTETV